jgi:glucosyl-3-phosphoglycerate synthase
MDRPAPRRFHHDQFSVDDLVGAKAATTVSVCLPAKDERATVGTIVSRLRAELVHRHPLVDEVVVVDDASTDDTALVAAQAGARVVSTRALLPQLGPGTGKGEALWKGVHATRGDIVVFCDADIVDFDPHFVTGLLGPLLTDPAVQFTKGFYERPTTHAPGTGGRTTELVARPLIALLFPHLADVVQPLSGEYAARRDVLEHVPFVQGYGVDLGLLLDVSARWGVDGIVQVDLGVRVHRNRTLDQLSPQAVSILQTAFVRAGMPARTTAMLVRPGLDPLACAHVERPPLAHVLRRIA